MGSDPPARISRSRRQLRADVRFLGGSYGPNGELVLNMRKYHAAHRCTNHRLTTYTEQDLDACMVCRAQDIERLLQVVAGLRGGSLDTNDVAPIIDEITRRNVQRGEKKAETEA